MKNIFKNIKILITSGGTIVKIDDVRHIGNFSTGYLMSQIATEALINGCKVFYLCAKNAKKPFQDYFIFNPLKSARGQFAQIKKMQKIYKKIKHNLNVYEFEDFGDYGRQLKKILSEKSIDIIFLGAAVSDYGVKKQSGKISSLKNKFKLTLAKNPKIIKRVKAWSKSKIFQVGFKLLSNVTEERLIKTAISSGRENKSDLTIANDLQKNRGENREVIMITSGGKTKKMTTPQIEKKILKFVVYEYGRGH
ncbi:MAG: phosphopantothenoylcysteine decarboxylase [bacterium]|nr:phosphopantothenoylcysteine decarboxylase [bacterium]